MAAGIPFTKSNRKIAGKKIEIFSPSAFSIFVVLEALLTTGLGSFTFDELEGEYVNFFIPLISCFIGNTQRLEVTYILYQFLTKFSCFYKAFFFLCIKVLS